MSSFSPTPAELALVNQVFAIADPKKLGIITGDAAVKAFAGAKVAPTVLGEIWAIADSENNGFLTKKGSAMALRLIGHAQKGETVTEALLQRPGPLAHIEGISPPKPASIPSSPPNSPPPGGPLPPLTAEDKAKFLRLFIGCGPSNGLLNGDKARDVFIKSKLPVDKLSQIWGLADSHDRGALDQADFTIAMYFIQGLMSGKITNLPPTLPPGLYEQAGGKPPVGVVTHGTGNSVSLSPSLTGSFNTSAPLAAQVTGGARARLQPQMTGSEYGRMSMVVPPQAHVTFAANPVAQALGASAFGAASQAWDVTAEEKARFDQFFDGLDTQRRGYIEGDIAVPFMLQSKLSGDVLALVWDLADLNNDGRLTRDGFAVAMHLIQQKISGKDIPSTLPPSLIPPSMRSGNTSAVAQPSVPEPIRDLLWDDDVPTSSPAQQPVSPPARSVSAQPTPTIQPQATGYLQQQQTGSLATRSPAFMSPADPFGGSSFSSAGIRSGSRDLLSDDEDTSSKLPDNSVELGNVQNQLNSTNRSLENTKAERQKTENELATQASQLSALQTQLSSAKAAYETETRLLTALKERLATQTSDIQKAREELIRAESDLSGVRVEKAEVEGQLLRDKEEVRGLQKKIKDVGNEVEQSKAAVEKAKKEAKHQKGLLAIAKKRLASLESDNEGYVREAAEVRASANSPFSVPIESPSKEENSMSPKATTITTFEDAFGISESSSTPKTEPVINMSPLPANPSEIFAPYNGGKSNENGVASGSPLFGAASPKTATTFEDAFGFGEGSTVALESSPATSTSPKAAAANTFEDAFGISESDPVTKAEAAADQPSFADPSDLFVPYSGEKENDNIVASKSSLSSPASPKATADPTSEDASGASESKTEPKAEPITSAQPPVDIPGSSSPKGEKANDSNIHIPSESLLPRTTPSNVAEATPFEDASGIEESSTAPTDDLEAKIVEKEESDSDDEGDFHDAAEARASVDVPSAKPVEAPSKEVNVAPPRATVATPFEDAFGVSESNAVPKAEPATSAQPFANPSDLFVPYNGSKVDNVSTAPESSLFNATNGTVAPAVSGVNAFDEALGKISSSGDSPAVSKFKLDSAFEDNFDFSAAKAELEPSSNPFPVPSPAAAVNGNRESAAPSPVSNSPFVPAPGPGKATPAANGTAFSFDDAFNSTTSAVSPKPAAQPQAGDLGITFEDAFGGGGNQALAFDDAFGSVSSRKSESRKSESTEPKLGTPKTSAPSAQTPSVMSPPLPPTQAPASPSTTRSVRSTSPPARVSSPKPRRSTGSSSVEGVPPSKSPPATRHSKLSIRLPFGRKDKKKSKFEPPPVPPPNFLSPVSEPVSANGDENVTPAAGDDVEPVKQLCGMGFSRTQAIEALEKHGYDVQRALNSLLGSTS